MIELFRNNSAKSELQSYKILDSKGNIIKLRKCSYTKHGIQLIQNEKNGWEWYKKSYDVANEIMIEHRTSGTSYEQINISWAKNFKKENTSQIYLITKMLSENNSPLLQCMD